MNPTNLVIVLCKILTSVQDPDGAVLDVLDFPQRILVPDIWLFGYHSPAVGWVQRANVGKQQCIQGGQSRCVNGW